MIERNQTGRALLQQYSLSSSLSRHCPSSGRLWTLWNHTWLNLIPSMSLQRDSCFSLHSFQLLWARLHKTLWQCIEVSHILCPVPIDSDKERWSNEDTFELVTSLYLFKVSNYFARWLNGGWLANCEAMAGREIDGLLWEIEDARELSMEWSQFSDSSFSRHGVCCPLGISDGAN